MQQKSHSFTPLLQFAMAFIQCLFYSATEGLEIPSPGIAQRTALLPLQLGGHVPSIAAGAERSAGAAAVFRGALETGGLLECMDTYGPPPTPKMSLHFLRVKQ